MSFTVLQHAANAYTQKLLELGRPPIISMTAMAAAVDAAMLAERERCATIINATMKAMDAERLAVAADVIERIHRPEIDRSTYFDSAP